MTNINRDVNSQKWDSLIKEYLESGLSVAWMYSGRLNSVN